MSGFGNTLRWFVRWERWRFLAILGAVILFTAVFVGISDLFQPEDVMEMMNKMPKIFQKMAGHQADKMLTSEFWLATLSGHPIWMLLMLCFPVAAGLRCLSGLQRDGSLEWILSHPVSRSQVYGAGVVVLLGGVTILSIAGGLAGWMAGLVWFPGEIRGRFVFELTVSSWAMLCAVAMFVLALSASLARPASWVISVIVGMAFLFLLGAVWAPAKLLGVFSLFSYHQPLEVYWQHLHWLRLLGAMGWTVFFGWFGWWRFRNRALAG